MKQSILFFFILCAASSFCTEEMPKKVSVAKARYLEKVNNQEEPLLFKDPLRDYFFHRNGECPGSAQDRRLSEEAYNYIQSKRRPHINFNRAKLFPFDHNGTCTAMALDFLARYHAACSGERSVTIRKRTLKDFKVYLGQTNSAFMSRQSAYNTIEIKNQRGISSDDIKHEKMQSLANYHDFEITPVTGTIKTLSLQTGTDLRGTFAHLPDGYYIIRMLYPADNEKGEYFGHTMSFVKDKDLSVFFDNLDGAFLIKGDLCQGVTKALESWGMEEFRIYHAVPTARGVNVRNDTCQARSLEYDESPEESEEISWE